LGIDTKSLLKQSQGLRTKVGKKGSTHWRRGKLVRARLFTQAVKPSNARDKVILPQPLGTSRRTGAVPVGGEYHHKEQFSVERCKGGGGARVATK